MLKTEVITSLSQPEEAVLMPNLNISETSTTENLYFYRYILNKGDTTDKEWRDTQIEH